VHTLRLLIRTVFICNSVSHESLCIIPISLMLFFLDGCWWMQRTKQQQQQAEILLPLTFLRLSAQKLPFAKLHSIPIVHSSIHSFFRKGASYASISGNMVSIVQGVDEGEKVQS
jgi:hypothetical protein